MIIPISRHNIELLLQYEPALMRALDRTTLFKNWDMKSLLDHVVNFNAYAFAQPESGYVAVFTINTSPLMRTMHVFWSGKMPDNDTPIDYPEVVDAMDDIARHFQCAEVVVEGRKGWEKIGKPLGYVEDARLYVKEVSYELPEIQPASADGCEPADGGSGEQPLQG